LLGPHGRLGFIVPNKLFKLDYGERLRKLFSERELVDEILDFGASQLFAAPRTTPASSYSIGGARLGSSIAASPERESRSFRSSRQAARFPPSASRRASSAGTLGFSSRRRRQR
jgi:hypothetical protein